MRIKHHKKNPNKFQARKVLLTLAGIMALQMISFGVIMPIFARRLSDFGAGVEALGLMAMAYSMTSIAASPFMGAFADRVGRRPLVLISLTAYVGAFTGYLLAPSTNAFIIIRVLAGGLTAGLGPAVMGIAADITPDGEKAQWIGVIGAGSSVGWVVGPTLGGLLFDQWGYEAPFIVSVVMASIALVTAFIMVPETHLPEKRDQAKASQIGQGSSKRNSSPIAAANLHSILQNLPQPFSTFALLLLISFCTIFAYAFIEPQLMFYVYDELGWSSARFGMAVSGLGLTLVIGQTMLGKLSDRFGRKPVLIIGIFLSTVMYATVSATTSFQMIFLAYIVAGMGEALMSPALNAFYLDMAKSEHKSRVMGIKNAAGALGGVAGPALVVVITRIIPPQSVFTIAVGLLVSVALIALILLKEPRKLATEKSGASMKQNTNQNFAAEYL